MFVAIYDIEVIPGKEDEFKSVWHQEVHAVAEKRGGLGARLHKVVNKENKWMVYAPWASREYWKENIPIDPKNMDPLMKRLSTLCTITVLHELEVIDDLLITGPPNVIDRLCVFSKMS